MAHAIGKALLGLAVAAVAAGSMSAQTVQDAVTQYRIGNEAKAIEMLQKIVASDPSDQEAFEMWRSIDQEVWHALLVSNGELGKIAKFLVGKARVARKEMSRDAAEIERACGRYRHDRRPGWQRYPHHGAGGRTGQDSNGVCNRRCAAQGFSPNSRIDGSHQNSGSRARQPIAGRVAQLQPQF